MAFFFGSVLFKKKVIYATHVFDGLDAWATHVLHLTKPTAGGPEAAASVPAVPSGRLVTVAEALALGEGAAAGSPRAAATAKAKKRTIYSTVLKWLVEENKAARSRDAEESGGVRAGNGEGKGDGGGATAAAALSFPTTAAARRARQDASICARSTAVARDTGGPLPVGWGFRANALPG